VLFVFGRLVGTAD